MQNIHNVKKAVLDKIANMQLDYKEWSRKVQEAVTIEELENIYNRANFVEKKKVLLQKLLEIGALDDNEKEKISACTDQEELNILTNNYTVLYYKMKLISQAKQLGLMNSAWINRIMKMSSIAEINNKTADLRGKIILHLEKENDTTKSLYGADFISTQNSIRAILTGMTN